MPSALQPVERLHEVDANNYHYWITMRNSRQREAILRVVRTATCHPTAEWVYGEVKKELPGISLGTVYRNLKVLSESGEVQSCDSSGGTMRYDGTMTSHHHFRCEGCGNMVDIEDQLGSELDGQVAARTGLSIRCHVLEFRGLCPDCQRVRPPSERQAIHG